MDDPNEWVVMAQQHRCALDHQILGVDTLQVDDWHAFPGFLTTDSEHDQALAHLLLGLADLRADIGEGDLPENVGGVDRPSADDIAGKMLQEDDVGIAEPDDEPTRGADGHDLLDLAFVLIDDIEIRRRGDRYELDATSRGANGVEV